MRLVAGLLDLLGPLDELSRDEVLASAVVHTDDTPVDVRNAHRKEQDTARFWDYVGDDGHRLVWFDYTPSRSRHGPARILKDFEGYLQADAFSGYDGIFVQSREKIREVACWAHSRRKFKDAQNTDVAWDRSPWHESASCTRSITVNCASGAKPNGRICWWRSALPGSLPSGNPSPPRPCSRPSRPGLLTEAGKLLPKEPMRQAIDYALSNWVCCAGTPRPGSSTSTITRPLAAAAGHCPGTPQLAVLRQRSGRPCRGGPLRPDRQLPPQRSLTCFRFFGQEILLFWTAGGELSDVEEQFREAW